MYVALYSRRPLSPKMATLYTHLPEGDVAKVLDSKVPSIKKRLLSWPSIKKRPKKMALDEEDALDNGTR